MNQEKIGKLIKKIRIKNKLSQKEFADKYGVTPQAVSKWETGKNIPDIAILKEICNDNNLKVDEFLSAKSKGKKNVVLVMIGLAIIVVGIGIISVIHGNNSFKLKTISSACEEFGLYGSIAYNKSKSSIYIDNVTYCGEEVLPRYKKISCTLFVSENGTINVINSYESDGEKSLTIDTFLKDYSFKIDDYEHSCNNFKRDSFYLEIKAVTLDGKVEVHKIPLILGDCE